MILDIKFVFFGTPKFAEIILEKLINNGFIPKAVVCNPDKPVSRKKIITPPPVKSFIRKHSLLNIPILQPEKLDERFKLQILSFKPDFFIIAAYAKLIPKDIIQIPHRLGAIGVHPSILPNYRGPSPIQTAIVSGEKTNGVTLYLLDEKMDHGPILAQQEIESKEYFNFPSLTDTCAEVGGELLIKTLPKFLAGEINALTQDESLATYTQKFKADDAFIDSALLNKAQYEGGDFAVKVDRMVRGLNPEPGVWTIQNGKRTKILEAAIEGGKLKIKKIQIAGEKPRNVLYFPSLC